MLEIHMVNTETVVCLIPEEDAVRACTINPAQALGVQAEVGSIEPGKIADFIVCNVDYSGRKVYLAGKKQ